MTLTTAQAQISSSSTSSSETLSIGNLSMQDIDDTSSMSSSSTVVSWIPGLPGKLLQAFGASTVELATQLVIKKRLSSISSQIDIHLRHDGTRTRTSSVVDAEHLQLAYRDLAELSSGPYKAKIQCKAMHLRLLMLRAIVDDQRSWLDASQTNMLKKIWSELDELASEAYDPNVQSTSHELKAILIGKIADELSGFRTNVRADDLRSLLAGSNIVPILCHDLAYGTGGYAVQSALDRISSSPWGASQLYKLNRHSSVVFDAAKRLLVDFDNAYSGAMAFRIFGCLVSSNLTVSRGELAKLFSGPDGLGRLVRDFESRVKLVGGTGTWPIDASCAALSSACRHGFTKDLVQLGVCAMLAELLGHFTHRDSVERSRIEDDEWEDCGVQRNHFGALVLLVKVLDEEDAMAPLLAAGTLSNLKSFGFHPNRDFSDWDLRELVILALRKFASREGQGTSAEQ